MKKLKEDLIEHLKSFITQERKLLFEEKIDTRTNHITVVLENIYQAHNSSASIRSADCFGIQEVHIIENYNNFKDNSEVSMGASKWVNIKRYNKEKENTSKTILKLKEKGYKIIATTPHTTKNSLYDINISDKSALIFGSEAKGCSSEAFELSDQKINIPMYGFTESFNISVAVALCLQHITYKMRESKIDWKLLENEKKEVMLKWLRESVKASKAIEEKFIKNYKI